MQQCDRFDDQRALEDADDDELDELDDDLDDEGLEELDDDDDDDDEPELDDALDW